MKAFQIIFVLIAFPLWSQQSDFKTYFENGNGNQSATYDVTVAFYENLASHFPTVKIREMGLDDSGKPLH
ncbi:MAG: hypothetical protein EOO48_14195, partial [Flavobacterium sp.]